MALSSALAIVVVGMAASAARADVRTGARADVRAAGKPATAGRELAALVDPAQSQKPHSKSSFTAGALGVAQAPARDAQPAQAQADATTAAIAPAFRERYLSTGDVSEVVAPRGADIERCYVDALGASRRGGKLDLMLVIARDGRVVSVDTAAPGLPAVASHQLHKCLRTAVDGLQFPARRNDTTAIVPYYFQRTDAPHAGPQLSCWNPRGC